MRVPVVLPTSHGDLHGVEVAAPDERGVIVVVHDLHRDLDEFGELPELLARSGFTCIAIDLPGHGLSEMDEIDKQRCVDSVRDAVRAALRGRQRVGLVASGSMSTIGSILGDDDGVSAQLLICPHLDDEIAAMGERTYAVRMVVHGEGPSLVGTETQRFFSPLIGEKLLVFNPSLLEGADALVASETLHTHVILFFQRYLNPTSRRPPA
jgi:hypothetical protein